MLNHNKDDIELPPGVDPTKPSAGRLYDLYLGGDQYLSVDRDAAERIRAKIPEIHDVAHANRAFLQRATRAMTRAGIDQFIDVGAGLPTRFNTYEVAQSVNSAARVVYVDNDPMILDHARSLLDGIENVAYITGDLREPQGILDHPDARRLIDFNRPVGYLLVAVLHFIADHDDPAGLIRQYMAAVPSGSYLAVSHITGDGQKLEKVQRFLDVYANATERLYFRTKAEIARLLEDLVLLPPFEGADPDLVQLGYWRGPTPRLDSTTEFPAGSWGYCAVGRKP